jgi:hypothetical protein
MTDLATRRRTTIADDIAELQTDVAELKAFMYQLRGGLRLAAAFNGVLIGVLVFLVARALG